jgi:hypothetical protein
VNTVAENRTNFNNQDYGHAEKARQIQKLIWRPSTRSFLKYVDNNLLPTCPSLIAISLLLWSRCWITRIKQLVAHLCQWMQKLQMKHYHKVVLDGDIMFVALNSARQVQ